MLRLGFWGRIEAAVRSRWLFYSMGDDSCSFTLGNGGWRRLLWLPVDAPVPPNVFNFILAVPFLR